MRIKSTNTSTRTLFKSAKAKKTITFEQIIGTGLTRRIPDRPEII